MTALLKHIALVSISDAVPLGDLAIVAAAIQKQVARDFAAVWDVDATVGAFPTLDDVPVDYWKVLVMDNISSGMLMGVHKDDQGQPYALVTAAADQNIWSLTASHECLEMLADPCGNRLVAADSPMEGQGRVQILVEVSDPSQGAQYGYSVNGVLVSDFYTPQYFDPVASPGVRYSYSGKITRPRQVLPGGYLTWHDTATGDWWQQVCDDNGPTFKNLGKISPDKGSFRSQIDVLSSRQSEPYFTCGRSVAKAAGHSTSVTRQASMVRADALRKCISQLHAQATTAAVEMVVAKKTPTKKKAAKKDSTKKAAPKKVPTKKAAKK